MQVLRVLPIFALLEGVDLHPEGHPLLAPVLPRGELGADAVHLWGMRQAVGGGPEPPGAPPPVDVPTPQSDPLHLPAVPQRRPLRQATGQPPQPLTSIL